MRIGALSKHGRTHHHAPLLVPRLPVHRRGQRDRRVVVSMVALTATPASFKLTATGTGTLI
jgi:hypothetical protein